MRRIAPSPGIVVATIAPIAASGRGNTKRCLVVGIALLAAAASGLFASTAAADGQFKHGEAAIKQLGSHLDKVAAEHATTARELAEELRGDPSLRVDESNDLLYLDEAGPTAGTAEEEEAAPFPLSETFTLHSDPGANRILYLDFDGGSYRPGHPPLTPILNRPVTIPAFTGTPATIQRIWQRVAEDYAPFGIDVTTEEPSFGDLADCADRCGARISIGGTADLAGFGPGILGVAPYGFSFGSVIEPTAFVFSADMADDELGVAATVSHEAGHTFGLLHHGAGHFTPYYFGNGSGPTGWCPLMGSCVSHSRPLSQWSHGEYPNADNPDQDDVAVIAATAPLRPDDVPGTAPLGGEPAAVDQPGLIGARDDTDDFAFTSGTGTATFAVAGAPRGPNLDAALELLDSTGAVVAQANDPDGLDATLTADVPAGQYVLRVDGVGDLDPFPGYSDYGSLGRYRITGAYPEGNRAPDCSTVVPDRTTLWPVDHKLHTVALGGATDPDGDPTALTVTAVTQDEGLAGGADAQAGTAADQVRVRAARAGHGDGRVYAIGYEVRDSRGATCTGTVTVGVPHSKKSTAVDSGQTVSSFG